MRKLSVVLFVLVLAVTFGSTTASAQTAISLGTSTTKGVTFTPTGGPIGMENLSMGVAIFGTAPGEGGLLGTNGYYSLSTPSPIMLTLGTSFIGPPHIADYTASGTLNFEITTLSGGMGTDLLKGTLSLIDLVQFNTSGFTDTSALANITITDGTLKGDFPGKTGIGELNINLSCLGFLPSLTGATATNLRNGALETLPTPEPWSMLLYGSGLVLIGFVLRRRLPRVRIAVRN